MGGPGLLSSGGNAPISTSGGHKLVGTSRNNHLIAPAGTKNKVGGGGTHIHTALVNLGNSSIGASLDDIAGVQGPMGNSQILNRTLGGTSGSGNRYF